MAAVGNHFLDRGEGIWPDANADSVAGTMFEKEQSIPQFEDATDFFDRPIDFGNTLQRPGTDDAIEGIIRHQQGLSIENAIFDFDGRRLNSLVRQW